MRLYALTCGHLRCRKNVFVPDAPKGEFSLTPVPVFVIFHPRGNVLFDTGPHPSVFQEALARWGGLAKAFEPVGDEKSGVLSKLKELNLNPGDFRYVVNSHLHFDHAGGNQFFPQSTFLVSAQEMEYARNPENEGKGYFRADWDHPLTHRFIEGPFDIFGDGGLVILPLPGHTPGHQGLLVRLKNQGPVVLSGDSVPFQENFLQGKIPRNHLEGERALESSHFLHELIEKEKALLIYGHDPTQWEKVRIAPAYYE
jgi:N-acyl homoserine lactone hydrolase